MSVKMEKIKKEDSYLLYENSKPRWKRKNKRTLIFCNVVYFHFRYKIMLSIYTDNFKNNYSNFSLHYYNFNLYLSYELGDAFSITQSMQVKWQLCIHKRSRLGNFELHIIGNMIPSSRFRPKICMWCTICQSIISCPCTEVVVKSFWIDDSICID